MVSIKCFSACKKIGVVCSCKLLRFASFHRQVSHISSSVMFFAFFANVFPGLAFFPEGRKLFLYPAFSVSIGCSHKISRHKPRIPSEKFNVCYSHASTQASIAKVGFVCEHWYPYFRRHQAPLRVLLTQVWKPVFD